MKDDFNLSTEEYYKDFPQDKIPDGVKKAYPGIGKVEPFPEMKRNLGDLNFKTLVTHTGIKEVEMPVTVVADNGGLRYSEGKPRYDLIPPDMLEALAMHYAQGAKKYADRNWERGMSWCECFRALMSHSWKWFRGEQYDVEDPKMPGYRAPHTIAMVWNAVALYCYEQRQIGKDDRHILNKKESK